MSFTFGDSLRESERPKVTRKSEATSLVRFESMVKRKSSEENSLRE
jgi:hypothetical protein